jgi:hypothetical protein
MFIEIPNFLSADDVEFFRTTFRRYANTPLERAYNRMGKSVNLDDIVSYGTEDVKQLHARLFPVFYRLVKDVVVPQIKPEHDIEDAGIEYHWYRPGDICEEHIDGITPFVKDSKETHLRFATVILHLTDSDGETIFPNQNRRFKTEAGKLLVFSPDSRYPHYTTPSTTDREIIMTWLIYKGIKVIKT